MLKAVAVFCVVILVVDGAIVKRETTPAPTLLEDFQENMDYIRNCVDHSVASVVGHVNEKQLKPVFNLVSETLNRVSKAFEDLTAPTSGPSHLEK